MKQAILIRNHISTAKRFFQRTLKSFKSLMMSKADDSSYQKLPKSTKRRIIKQVSTQGSGVNGTRSKTAVRRRTSRAANHDPHHQESESCKRELRMRMVAQRLKEMEMVDKSNVHHLLDIEEVFHYYSRLTCPVYLEIVDQFFTELQAEFLGADQPFEIHLIG